MAVDYSRPPPGEAVPDEPSTELDDDLTVMRRDDRNAYIATLANVEVATVQYDRAGARLVLLTTTVIPAYRGRGISDELIAYALDDIRERGERITVLCPVVKAFLERYPENLDLVDAARPDF